MKVKELLFPAMKRNRYRASDIAEKLSISRQAVSQLLNRPVQNCTVKRIQKFAEAVEGSLTLIVK